MRILIVGGGGREHAIAWALRRDNPDAVLYCAPGNPGTEALATNLPIPADRSRSPRRRGRCLRHRPHGRGPRGAAGARPRRPAPGGGPHGLRSGAGRGPDRGLQGVLPRSVMRRAGVPTATTAGRSPRWPRRWPISTGRPSHWWSRPRDSRRARAPSSAPRAARPARPRPRCSGKADSGTPGRVVVIEEFMEGEELSVLAITNGQDLVAPAAGAGSQAARRRRHRSQHRGHGRLQPRRHRYAGAARAGGARGVRANPDANSRGRAPITTECSTRGSWSRADGTPRVVEFNCRLGDPETQAILPLVEDGLTECLWQVAERQPADGARHRPAARGHDRSGRERLSRPTRKPAPRSPFRPSCRRASRCFTPAPHATRMGPCGRTAVGCSTSPPSRSTFTEAQTRSRDASKAISFPGKIFRRDIGWREAVRQKLGV